MTDNVKRQRRSRGSAWHWKQTDCWYYTPPGTKRRIPLLAEDGTRIRGKTNRQAAELALARVKVAGQWRPSVDTTTNDPWTVAKACAEYIAYCKQGIASGTISADYCASVVRYLNSFCEYCGMLPISELSKGHVQYWIEIHPTWRSPVTRRNAITIVLAAMNYTLEMHGVQHRLKGLKKPPSRPRLHSFSKEEESQIYEATDAVFRDFLFAAICTGLRPYCELARITADDVTETDRGMMWRVYSTKTKKTRKIPVRSEVAEVCRRLMKTAPARSGIPLFRNSHGTAWLKEAAVGRFLAIKEDLGWNDDPRRRGYSCYTCRHTFAHRMLSGYWNGGAGCSIETLGELMGNTPKVCFDHYGKEWGQQYQDPLWAAVGLVGERLLDS